MARRALALSAVVCTYLLVSVDAVQAQSSPRSSTEWFAGYSYLRDPGSSILTATADDDSFPWGWTAGAARPVSRWVSVVGEASGHYKSRTTLVEDVELSFHAFAGGARISAQIGRVTEFAQALAGIVHGRGSAFGTTVSFTDLTLQPGGGLDYPLARRLAARIEVDYRWIRGSEGRDHASQFRLVAAAVLH